MATSCERTICRRHDEAVEILEENDEGKLPSLVLLSKERMRRLTISINFATGGRQDEEQESDNEMDERAMREGLTSRRDVSMKEILLSRSPAS